MIKIIRAAAILVALAVAAGNLMAQAPLASPNAAPSSGKQAAEKPLPNIASLLRDVEAHQKQVEAVRRNYMFREMEQEDELDSDGKVKHSKVEEREVFFIGRHPVTRLLRKDGVELSPSEQKKEQERVDKQISAAKKNEAKRQHEAEQGKHDENKITIDTLLDICKFSNPRRDSFKGRDSVIFDFRGNPEAKTHGMAESALKKLSGTVWIDEAGREVVRMEVRFDEAFKVGGGLLASVQKGSTFIFEQAFVNEEVWLPTYADVNLAARLLLFKGIREHSVTHFSDYRKFRVDSKITLAEEEKPH